MRSIRRVPRGKGDFLMGTMGTGVRTPAYADTERDDKHYRYSVKCDRTFAMRLDVAAAKAGMSVTSFVQAHFETILERPAPAVLPPFDVASFDPVAFSRRTNVAIPASRIWAAMRERANTFGELNISQAEIERATGVALAAIPKLVLQLKEAGLLVQISGAASKAGARYRVMGG